VILSERKLLGSYYTPSEVVASLVKWAARADSDRLLDPACGDGRFLAVHGNSVGVEQDPHAAGLVHQKAPGSLMHEGDFFAWAAETRERFECAAGNPPFIRYQRFSGAVRERAIALCAAHGARFTALTSSWAPFIVATSTVLKRGGRMAFVVPAEIGHAPYAQPVLKHLAKKFDFVQVLAIREKLFPELSEDCWLLYCEGYGGSTDRLALSVLETFHFQPLPPRPNILIPMQDWQQWNCRLRPYLLPSGIRRLYREVSDSQHSVRLRDVARVGIGYVTGANDFFHLRPSEANRAGIPQEFLRAAVRNGRCLIGKAITRTTVEGWRRHDEPILLLRLQRADRIPPSVQKYLDSAAGRKAKETYKCRKREPWYAVPDVTVPSAFLSYMSGGTPSLVANQAKCVATNSIHVIRLNGALPLAELQKRWHQPLTALSCELEGHPLGGGMLKIEPREAGSVVLARHRALSREQEAKVVEGLKILRRWRHYGQSDKDLRMD
jgi:adenine-specific DNA methylase